MKGEETQSYCLLFITAGRHFGRYRTKKLLSGGGEAKVQRVKKKQKTTPAVRRRDRREENVDVTLG